MLVQDILLRYPPTIAVFRRYGMPCPACMASVYENVSQIAVMLAVDLRELLSALNEAVIASPRLPASQVAVRLPYGAEPGRN
jgi:hybrid cluster-associated redox disulfide protein